MRGGWVGAKSQNLSCWTSVLVNAIQRGWYLGCENLVGVGYTVFEVVGGCDWVACKRGGLVGAKSQKVGCQGLVWGNKMGGGGLAFGWCGSGWHGGNKV